MCLDASLRQGTRQRIICPIKRGVVNGSMHVQMDVLHVQSHGPRLTRLCRVRTEHILKCQKRTSLRERAGCGNLMSRRGEHRLQFVESPQRVKNKIRLGIYLFT